MEFKDWLAQIEESALAQYIAALGLAAGHHPEAQPVQKNPMIAQPQAVNIAPRLKVNQPIELMFKTLSQQLSGLLGGDGHTKFDRFSNLLLSQTTEDMFNPANFDQGTAPKWTHNRQDLTQKLAEVGARLMDLHNNLDKIEMAWKNLNEPGFNPTDMQNVKAFRARNIGEFMATVDTLSDLVDKFMQMMQEKNPEPDKLRQVTSDIIMSVDELYKDRGFMQRVNLALQDLDRKKGEKPNVIDGIYGEGLKLRRIRT